MKEIAIIGATACGKSSLALELAKETNSYILSLDSLAIYKYIDIISAKPSQKELEEITHFGISLIEPNQNFSASDFVNLYRSTKKKVQKVQKNLIIVGGSSFYLKTIIDGLSNEPKYSKEAISKTKELLINIDKAYKFLLKIDPNICKTIKQNDRYRIEKALLIYFHTGINLSEYREKNSKKNLYCDIKVYEIEINKEDLRKKISQRTELMIKNGAIDEVAWLELHYTREPKPMNSIGIKEILLYLDGKINKKTLLELISTHTTQLAKRQISFNKNQFKNTIKKQKNILKKEIFNILSTYKE